jgi:hypothetical protein
MEHIDVAQTLDAAKERIDQIRQGERVIPVLTAVIAVFAALAMLFANHSSITGLQARTQAGILMTRSNQAILSGDMIQRGGGRDAAFKKAQSYESDANVQLEKAERSMRSYESLEVAATLFQVAVVIVSITALMRGARTLIFVGCGVALVGLGFFITGLLMH